jgi:phosphatidylglycerol:prolipoprotein diacylglycerol transferase
MASHGGMIGVLVAAILFARRHKLDWRHLGDLTVLGGSVGIFFGRIANFINGELFGREAAPGSWFVAKFPGEMYLWLKHDREKALTDLSADLLPRLNEAVKTIGVNVDQWMSWVSHVRTDQMARFQIQNVINRLIDATQHGNEAARQALGAVLTPRYPSQLFEACLEGLVMFLIAFFFWRKPRKPGVVGSLWLSCYAVVRIIGEQFRLPDADIGYQLFGLTRGQWLSIAMLVISIGLLIYCSRRKVPVIGGWGAEARALREREPYSLAASSQGFHRGFMHESSPPS